MAGGWRITWVIDHAAGGGAGLQVLNDADGKRGWAIGCVTDEGEDATGAADGAPWIAVGIEGHEHVAGEQRDDGGVGQAMTPDVQRQVAGVELVSEFACGEGFVAGLSGAAEPTATARRGGLD